MALGTPDTDAESRAALSELIVRRLRIGLGAIAAGVLIAMIGDHALMRARPQWADAIDIFGVGLVAIAFWLLRRPAVRARPVPVALLIVAFACGVRALSGIGFGDVVPTAVLCVVVALTAGVSMPWGMWPQLASAAIAGAAIMANALLIDTPLPGPPAHLVAAIFMALAISVVLAAELRRHHLQLFEEILQRRRAEESVARLNAELELRVEERTAQLAAAKQRLEQEALERQQATHELRESQKRLQDILDNAPAVIHMKDREGRYLLVNRHWETLFGMPGAQAVGKTPHAVLPAAIVERLLANDRTVLDSRQPLQVEEALVMHGEQRTYLSVKFPLVDSDDTLVGVCGISTDITARKRAEERAGQHRAELAHVLRIGTMGEMAAGLAHEINQPLGAIANYAQGCVHRLRAGAVEPSTLLPVVEQIAREALRAGEIIRRLRDLVRKESPAPATLDLNRLVRESARMIENEARQLGINVQLELAPDLPGVTCDGIQIEQVLLNLLLNGVEAVQASGNGERVVAVTTAPAASGVEVAVRDSGVGIPPPPTDVFAPFFTTKSNGLGMGLSISRSIIEAHGGHLSAVRNPDHGSTFRFTLPIGNP